MRGDKYHLNLIGIFVYIRFFLLVMLVSALLKYVYIWERGNY